MELSFIAGALRRYWWIVVILAVLGGIPGLIVRHDAIGKYEATAVLLVSPPSQSAAQVSLANDPDRYVIGQLSVLKSSALASVVATGVGNGQTSASIGDAVSVSHVPKTDIVQIKASTTNPALSQAIANQYAKSYLDQLHTQVDVTQQTQISPLQTQLDALLTQLSAVNGQIATAMAPYLNAKPISATSGYPPIPDPSTVVPALVTQRDTLISQYNQLLQSKTQVQLNGQLQVTSQVVQPAAAPTKLSLPRSKLYVIIGVVAGAFVGAVLCALIARISARVVNADQLGDVLGYPVVGRMPKISSLARDRRNALEAIEPQAAHFIDTLCVRAEANVRHGRAATILVVGTLRSAGATTLASALAARFAAGGSDVLLIDTNMRRPELTVLYAKPGQSGLAGLLAQADGRSPDGARMADAFSQTQAPGVRVVGIGPRGDAPPLRRQTVPLLVEVACTQAQVVVFDGGPLLDAASNTQLAELVDAVVLAIPADRQKLRDLEVIARQLQGVRGEVLPVIVPAARPRRRRPGTPRPAPSAGSATPPRPPPDKADAVAMATKPPAAGDVVTAGRPMGKAARR